MPAPGTNRVHFSTVPGFQTPPDAPVTLSVGQDAILTYTYEAVPPVLSVTLDGGPVINGTVGTMVHLQFRAALGVGSWADVAGKVFTLGAAPVPVFTATEAKDAKAQPGFSRVFVP